VLVVLNDVLIGLAELDIGSGCSGWQSRVFVLDIFSVCN
jgi:hypothetical protein